MEAFWTEFLRHQGPRLRLPALHVHFLRDCLGYARKDQRGRLAALIRPIFNADSREQARDRLSEAVAHLDGRLPKIATVLERS
jgi:putative transposase